MRNNEILTIDPKKIAIYILHVKQTFKCEFYYIYLFSLTYSLKVTLRIKKMIFKNKINLHIITTSTYQFVQYVIKS